MIFIAHRGLTNGPDSLRENSPSQILYAIEEGFIAEMDVWLYQDNVWFGHDEPTFLITQDIADRFWGFNSQMLMHCKNPESFKLFEKIYTEKNGDSQNGSDYFWHDKDRFTISKKGLVLENTNESDPADGTIISQPEIHDFFSEDTHLNVLLAERFIRRYAMNAAGIMTKYPRLFREAWERIQNDQYR